MTDNNEFQGSFPVRQDTEVKFLPADDPTNLRLGWKIYEEVGSVSVSKPIFEQMKKDDWTFIWRYRWQRFCFWTKEMWNIFINRIKGRKPSDCHKCKLITHTPGAISVYNCFGKMQADLIKKDPDVEYIQESLKIKRSGYCPYFQQMSEKELQDLEDAEEYYDKHLRPRGPNGEVYY